LANRQADPGKIVTNEELVYWFVIRYKTEHDGNSPSVREIAEGIAVNSTSLVKYYLRNLENDGLLLVEGPIGKSRCIQVVGGKWEFRTDEG
jgi:hypothetical protein